MTGAQNRFIVKTKQGTGAQDGFIARSVSSEPFGKRVFNFILSSLRLSAKMLLFVQTA